MISFILNYVCCSLLLYIPYKLWIENTSLLTFKRIYLLGVIILPLIIPTINYTIGVNNNLQPLPIPNIYVEDKEEHLMTPELLSPTTIVSKSETIDWTKIVVIIYSILSCIMLLRFLFNIYSIYSLKKDGQKIKNKDYTIIVSEKVKSPFSFWNYVFVNKIEYQKGIEHSIWKHEEGHIIQYHSFDILLLEIIKIITFFNPVLYFTKSSMKFNHECLADRYVLKDRNIAQEYCFLLLNLPNELSHNHLVSELNYKQIKKRLIMMSHKTSTIKKIAWYGLSFVILITCTIIFSKKNIVLGENIKQITLEGTGLITKQDTTKQKTANGAPSELLAEYDSVMNAITTYKKDKLGNTYTNRDLSRVDVRRMSFIASLMSNEQSQKRTEKHQLSPHKFWNAFVTKPKQRTPSKPEFDNWQNSEIYGVWIDGKKSKNSDLKKLKNTDIVLYYVSKLYGKAKVGRSYTHQLDVYTQPYYDKAFKDYKSNFEIKPVK